MREWAKGVVKKVTLELVYEKLEKIERRQEEDFRYLNQKIDTQIGQIRQEIKEETGQLRQEMGQLRQEINQLRQEIAGINSRIDTLIQIERR